MARTPCCDQTGLKKGTWTPEEDRKLIAYVTRYGCWNWRRLPKFAGLSRCGKSCRLRWLNYLQPNIKRGNFNKEEEDTIIRLHEAHGNKWSMIAAHLPGRTDNEVKNHWHTNLKKRVKQERTPYRAKKIELNIEGRGLSLETKNNNTNLNNNSPSPTIMSHQILESSPMSPQPSSSEFSSTTRSPSTEPAAVTSSTNWDVDSFETYEELINGDFWTEPFVAEDSFYIAQQRDVVEPFLIDNEFSFPQSPVTCSGGGLLGQFGFYEENYCLNW